MIPSIPVCHEGAASALQAEEPASKAAADAQEAAVSRAEASNRRGKDKQATATRTSKRMTRAQVTGCHLRPA